MDATLRLWGNSKFTSDKQKIEKCEIHQQVCVLTLNILLALIQFTFQPLIHHFGCIVNSWLGFRSDEIHQRLLGVLPAAELLHQIHFALEHFDFHLLSLAVVVQVLALLLHHLALVVLLVLQLLFDLRLLLLLLALPRLFHAELLQCAQQRAEHSAITCPRCRIAALRLDNLLFGRQLADDARRKLRLWLLVALLPMALLLAMAVLLPMIRRPRQPAEHRLRVGLSLGRRRIVAVSVAPLGPVAPVTVPFVAAAIIAPVPRFVLCAIIVVVAVSFVAASAGAGTATASLVRTLSVASVKRRNIVGQQNGNESRLGTAAQKAKKKKLLSKMHKN